MSRATRRYLGLALLGVCVITSSFVGFGMGLPEYAALAVVLLAAIGLLWSSRRRVTHP
jgi:uncharacterized protein (DUF58 family)